jgi:hypothetical protein
MTVDCVSIAVSFQLVAPGFEAKSHCYCWENLISLLAQPILADYSESMLEHCTMGACRTSGGQASLIIDLSSR